MSVSKKSIKSDLRKLDAQSDEKIDYSDIESLDESFFSRTIVDLPHPKDSITLRVDHDVLQWFKKRRGYQTLMNAILKSYVKAHQ